MSFPECPPSLRPIQHYLKTAIELEGRDPCVVYWCRVYALQIALRLQTKKPEETALLLALMDWLENEKKNCQDNESITNEVAAQAHLENYALKLFLYADKQDREGNYGKNVVKAFYKSGILYDVLQTFGELTDEVIQNRKYAKWKAAYIHNCLKNGEVPVPGPLPSEEDEGNPPTSDEANFSAEASNFIIDPTGPSPSSSSANSGFDAFPTNSFASPTIGVLPSVPQTADPNPGGFHAYVPPVSLPTENRPSGPVSLTPEQMAKAQKYCKWAGSALNYDDVTTAITNLSNALQLLQTGHDPA